MMRTQDRPSFDLNGWADEEKYEKVGVQSKTAGKA